MPAFFTKKAIEKIARKVAQSEVQKYSEDVIDTQAALFGFSVCAGALAWAGTLAYIVFGNPLTGRLSTSKTPAEHIDDQICKMQDAWQTPFRPGAYAFKDYSFRKRHSETLAALHRERMCGETRLRDRWLAFMDKEHARMDEE